MLSFKKLGESVLQGGPFTLSTKDGSRIDQAQDGNLSLVELLVRLQCTDSLNWCKVLENERLLQSSHVLDFGPGYPSPVAQLTGRMLVGTGSAVLTCFSPTEMEISSTFLEDIEDKSIDNLLDAVDSAISDEKEIKFDANNVQSLYNILSKKNFLLAREKAHQIRGLLAMLELPNSQNWSTFAPILTRRKSDNAVLVDNRWTRALGKPPIMVAGMTPTTSYNGIHLVAAVSNAGFHVELAAGGLPRPSIFREKVRQVTSLLQPGNSITLNLLFLNAKQWSFQFPMIKQLVAEGAPIEGICIAAGVPSLEKIDEIMQELRACNIKQVAFKPGSIDAIRSVVEIARIHKDMTIIVQWTGGRAGGHHSFEDFHEPMLQCYGLLRSLSNVLLVCGSGFGDGDESIPYLTGEWSRSWGLSRMPFDAVLFASRLMVAKEAATAKQVKQMIVDTPGLAAGRENEWEKSYQEDAGGVITVTSELGEPIHVIHNRCTALWRKLDLTLFELPQEQQKATILSRKSELIDSVNRDFQKVYFGQKANGSIADIHDMTYEEVLRRMVQLMFIPKTRDNPDELFWRDNVSICGRWIDSTYRDRLFAFVESIEPRFIQVEPTVQLADESRNPTPEAAPEAIKDRSYPLWSDASILENDPIGAVNSLITQYPEMSTRLMCVADIDAWLDMIKNGGKPVPFIPVIDADFKLYFKKDSLWYSEDLAAVPNQDPQRVFVLQGPIAVRHSTIVDQPAEEILQESLAQIIHGLRDLNCDDTQSTDGTGFDRHSVVYLGCQVLNTPRLIVKKLLEHIHVFMEKFQSSTLIVSNNMDQDHITVQLVTDNLSENQLIFDIDPTEWIFCLAHSLYGSGSWLHASLLPSFVACSRGRKTNPLPKLFSPRGNIQVTIQNDSIKLYRDGNEHCSVELQHQDFTIMARIFYTRPPTADIPMSQLIPLELSFEFRPQFGACPLLEHDTRNQESIKLFYQKVWVSSNSGEDGSFVFQSRKEEMDAFVAAIGCNNCIPVQESDMLDWSIVAVWKPLISALWMDHVQGNLLDLVHLSNQYQVFAAAQNRLDNGSAIFFQGDMLHSSAKLVQLSATETGRTVRVVGTVNLVRKLNNIQEVSQDGECESKCENSILDPLVQVTSEFFIREANANASTRTMVVDMPLVRKVLLESTHDIHILRSKPWILPLEQDINENTNNLELSFGSLDSLVPGSIVEFDVKISSEDDRSTVTGSVFIISTMSTKRTRIASVVYDGPSLTCDPVTGYLNRHSMSDYIDISMGKINLSQNTTLEPFHLLRNPVVFQSPISNSPYAIASQDVNPIHTDEILADFAGLPTTIVHGMWLSAAVKHIIVDTFNQKAEDREQDEQRNTGVQEPIQQRLSPIMGCKIQAYRAEFLDMLHPNTSLYTQITQSGVLLGGPVITAQVCTKEGRVIMRAMAHMSPPKTAYVFTGQGSAEPGMGMDLYEKSNTVRQIWDSADRFMQSKYGFSILHIVRNNPKSITIRFGGKKGAQIRENYMNLTMESPDGIGKVPIIPDITISSDSYTFVSAQGLLFSTQFTQPALVLLEKAYFDDAAANQAIPNNFMFAGHSLGEYAALASAGKLLSVEALVELVFMRGLVMQKAVHRDEQGRSEFAMVAASPVRVSGGMDWFGEDELQMVVDTIAERSGKLLQVVNYNVRGGQYVVAGHVESLYAMGSVLDSISQDPALFLEDPIDSTHSIAEKAIQDAKNESREASKRGEILFIPRGKATIPLPGIDVPFHSTFLRPGVPAFRTCLTRNISMEAASPDLLVGRYIPNVLAKPFELTRKYVNLALEATKSPILRKLLEEWPKTTQLCLLALKKRACYTLVIELLAYQFASPVRWIETQDVLIMHNIERLIEIGPSPVLSTMAVRSLAISKKMGYTLKVNPTILTSSKDSDAIYCARANDNGEAAQSVIDFVSSIKEEENATVENEETKSMMDESESQEKLQDAASVSSKDTSIETASIKSTTSSTLAKPFVSLPQQPLTSIENTFPQDPPSALFALRVLIASKTKNALIDIKPNATIKSIVRGKSALQNEIIGDLSQEFSGNFGDNISENPLESLAAIATWSGPGKILGKMLGTNFSSKMPAGFTQAKARDYLATEWDLGSNPATGVLVYSILSPPSSRLKTNIEVERWLDDVVQNYAHAIGHVNVSKPASISSNPTASPPMFTGGMTTIAQPIIESVPDTPLTPEDAIYAIICRRLNTTRSMILAERGDRVTIKSLVGGKSAMQNELVGEFQKEFGSLPDGVAELPISELSLSISSQTGYSSMGKVTATLVSKLISSKMPAGYGLALLKDYLQNERMLGPGRCDAVLLYAISMEPDKRLDSESAVYNWLNSVVDSYSSSVGVSIPRRSEMVISPMPASIPMSTSVGTPLATVDATNDKLREMLRSTIEAYNGFLGEDPREDGRELAKIRSTADEAERSLRLWVLEHGEEYEKGIQPKFDAAKIREYCSYWNWVVQDAYQLYKTVEVRHLRGNEPWCNDLWFSLLNRATPELLEMVRTYAAQTRKKAENQYIPVALIRGIHKMCDELEASLSRPPLFNERLEPTSPHVELLEDGTIVYEEIPRQAVKTARDFVLEMARGWFTSELQALARSKISNFADNFSLTSPLGETTEEELHGRRARNPQSDRTDIGTEGETEGEQTVDNNDQTLLKDKNGLPMQSDDELHEEQFFESSSDLALESARQRSGSWSAESRVKDVESTIDTYDSDEPDATTSKPSLNIRRSNVARKKIRRRVYGSNIEKKEKETDSSIITRNQQPLPYLHLQRPDTSAGHSVARVFCPKSTQVYLASLLNIADCGISFVGKTALVTGCGKGSIGLEVMRRLLEGGATVIATTSSFGSRSNALFREVYERHGGRDSRLIVLPFNQASQQDVNQLIDFVYKEKEHGGLELDLDLLIPFAAISENGRDIGNIDSRSELSHRLMLTNLVRLLGALKNAKSQRGIDTRPCHVILPLSPNHGLFGNDGLYAESKMALEAVLQKWFSEGWGDYLSVCGAVIGWTRGTGLMSANNVVAPGVEARGCRTFSTSEMAFALSGLMHPAVIEMAQQRPVWADLGGGFSSVENLPDVARSIRESLQRESQVKRAVFADKLEDTKNTMGPKAVLEMQKQIQKKNLPTTERVISRKYKVSDAKARYSMFDFPSLPSEQRRSSLNHLKGMIDPDQVVVVVGFGEVGPWGSCRTRWEVEKEGELSIEGCIELAWICGLIRYHSGPLPGHGVYHGWIVIQDGSPISESQVKIRFEEHILSHCGVRIIESDLFGGYQPNRKQFWHQVAIEKDMPPIEVMDYAEAEEYRKELGEDKVDIIQRKSDGQWMVIIRRGSIVQIPRALNFSRWVAGQIPTGWDASRYGIPKDIIDQVDTVTLYTLVATGEALMNAGIVDPYEMYQYVHVSEVGNTIGGGMGGMRSLRNIFRMRMQEEQLAGDTLQESFINTMSAWVNLLLLSSSGPIKTPVGACATAAESVELAVDTILSGKAKIVVCGGTDDFSEEGSYEFAQMKATSDTSAEAKAGREPHEMCRPMTTTRSGFMESHGSGVQVLTSARVAISMGLPIYGIVALTNTATDKEGRSVPAPGRGILTTAREQRGEFESLLLDIEYRRSQLERELKQVDEWKREETQRAKTKSEEIRQEATQAMVLSMKRVASSKELDAQDNSQSDLQNKVQTHAVACAKAERFMRERTDFIECRAHAMKKSAYTRWVHEFYQNEASISPLRGALAVWGLTPNDVGIASFHGTGTKANDTNESDLTNMQFSHLDRTPGNPLFVITQKWLTGHPKGAAAAWMMNGLVQSMLEGIVPGNRNADDIDPKLRADRLLVYPNRTLCMGEIRAGLLKSFGFGQAGAEILVVHPDFLLGSLSDQDYSTYTSLRNTRRTYSHRQFQSSLCGKSRAIQIKNSPPYTEEAESAVYLNPMARAQYNPQMDTWVFPSNPEEIRSMKYSHKENYALQERVAQVGQALEKANTILSTLPNEKTQESFNMIPVGVGIDVEEIKTFENVQQSFIERNFTSAEQIYCMNAPDPASSLAGRWAAKEAVIKAISSASLVSNLWGYPEDPLSDIEIVMSASGLIQYLLLSLPLFSISI